VEESYVRAFPTASREVPAVVFRHGLYHLFSSGCSGWDPNPCQHAVAERMDGSWRVVGDPCVGEGSETTFRSQGSFILSLADGETIFLADRWVKEDLQNSRYVWLPMTWEGERARIRWQDSWSPSIAPGQVTAR